MKSINLDRCDWLTVHHEKDNHQMKKWFFFVKKKCSVQQHIFILMYIKVQERKQIHQYLAFYIAYHVFSKSLSSRPFSIGFIVLVNLYDCGTLNWDYCMRDVNEQQMQQKKYLKCQAILQFFWGDKAIPEINKYILKTPWLIFYRILFN